MVFFLRAAVRARAGVFFRAAAAPLDPAAVLRAGAGAAARETRVTRDQLRRLSASSSPARVGCVLAIQNRSADRLERTLDTYAYQTLEPIDKVLVDYGSGADHSGRPAAS